MMIRRRDRFAEKKHRPRLSPAAIHPHRLQRRHRLQYRSRRWNVPVSAPSITDQPEAPLPTGTADASVWDVFGITPPVTRPRNELDSLIVDLRTPPPAQPISVTRAFDRPVPIVPPESHVPDAADNSPIAGSVKFIPVQSIGKATVRVRRVDTQKRQIKATIRVRRL